ncbi:MAG: sugar phosphate nucleotidyltransferase, partial [Patescibacteria group bacterium]
MILTKYERGYYMAYPRPTKAVIAAAGFGTRFLPQTKAMPKEMLPLVDKPIIQYVVEELVSAGIKDIIIVTGYGKRSIEDHFDVPTADLAAMLSHGGKEDSLGHLHDIANMANFIYVRQKEPLGNSAPLLYASHLINDEPFIYTWGDDFIDATPPRFEQMIAAYEKTGSSIVSCIHAQSDEDYDRYGFVTGEKVEGLDDLLKMSTIIENRGKADAPSDLASVSGFLFTPEITSYIQKAADQHQRGTELKIQSVMQAMMDDGHAYYACEIKNSA